jgi:hypothetical protein
MCVRSLQQTVTQLLHPSIALSACKITSYHCCVSASFRARERSHMSTASKGLATDQTREFRGTIMKTLLSALLALSVMAGIAASASAFDAKTFFEQVDREHE